MLIPKAEKIRDKVYRRWLSQLYCVVTGSTEVQVSHLRKRNGGGTGLKPSDKFCLPLSVDEHRKQHEIGEEAYWSDKGGYDRAVKLSNDIYEIKYDHREFDRLVAEWRAEWN